jgi:TPR repeat protein
MTIKDAIAASRRGDYADAISLFRPLADQGDADAQYGLGRIYLDHGEYFENKDVPLNDDNEIQAFNDRWDEGAKWFRLAADQGHARAQCRLGSMYLRGDYAEATRLLRLAADQGHAGAQWILGCAFAGNISPGSQRRHWQRGDAEAVKWFRLAANQGHLEAQYKLGTMYLKGSDEGEDLGYIYLKDQNVPQDYAEAAKWLRLAANQGRAKAQCKLGFMYHNGPDEAVGGIRPHLS